MCGGVAEKRGPSWRKKAHDTHEGDTRWQRGGGSGWRGHVWRADGAESPTTPRSRSRGKKYGQWRCAWGLGRSLRGDPSQSSQRPKASRGWRRWTWHRAKTKKQRWGSGEKERGETECLFDSRSRLHQHVWSRRRRPRRWKTPLKRGWWEWYTVMERMALACPLVGFACTAQIHLASPLPSFARGGDRASTRPWRTVGFCFYGTRVVRPGGPFLPLLLRAGPHWRRVPGVDVWWGGRHAFRAAVGQRRSSWLPQWPV